MYKHSPYINRYCRRRESGVNFIDRDRIEGIRGVAADINDYAESPLVISGNDLFLGNKRRDFGCEIDAIDEYVNFQDFLEWTTLRRLCKIPLENVIPANPNI